MLTAITFIQNWRLIRSHGNNTAFLVQLLISGLKDFSNYQWPLPDHRDLLHSWGVFFSRLWNEIRKDSKSWVGVPAPYVALLSYFSDGTKIMSIEFYWVLRLYICSVSPADYTMYREWWQLTQSQWLLTSLFLQTSLCSLLSAHSERFWEIHYLCSYSFAEDSN